MATFLKRRIDRAQTDAADREVRETVEHIIADIAQRGDAAVRELSAKFDRWAPAGFRLSQAEIDKLMRSVPEGTLADIRFAQEQVRPMGRPASGVIGMGIDDKDRIVGMDLVQADASLLVVTANGFGKRTALPEYPPRGRGTGGVVRRTAFGQRPVQMALGGFPVAAETCGEPQTDLGTDLTPAVGPFGRHGQRALVQLRRPPGVAARQGGPAEPGQCLDDLGPQSEFLGRQEALPVQPLRPRVVTGAFGRERRGPGGPEPAPAVADLGEQRGAQWWPTR